MKVAKAETLIARVLTAKPDFTNAIGATLTTSPSLEPCLVCLYEVARQNTYCAVMSCRAVEVHTCDALSTMAVNEC